MHLKHRLKKEQLLEERYQQIEHDNQILLEKMSAIIRTKGGIDNVNTSMQYGQSLNRESRKRELQRISKANLAMLRRIQHAPPAYDHLKWEEDALNAQEYSAALAAAGGRNRVPGT